MVCKLDDSRHHKRRAANWQFRVPVKVAGAATKTWEGPIGQAAVDFVTWTPTSTELQLVEVKDYRLATKGLPSELPDIVARKVRDSLATLAIACGDATSDVHPVAQNLSQATKTTAILDIRLPPGTPTPSSVLADIQMKLKATMKNALRTLVAGPGAPVNWTKRDLP